jgi:hypothetical protein
MSQRRVIFLASAATRTLGHGPQIFAHLVVPAHQSVSGAKLPYDVSGQILTVRQIQIHPNKVRPPLLERFDSERAILRDPHLKAGASQHLPQSRSAFEVVFDDQNAPFRLAWFKDEGIPRGRFYTVGLRLPRQFMNLRLPRSPPAASRPSVLQIGE